MSLATVAVVESDAQKSFDITEDWTSTEGGLAGPRALDLQPTK